MKTYSMMITKKFRKDSGGCVEVDFDPLDFPIVAVNDAEAIMKAETIADRSTLRPNYLLHREDGSRVGIGDGVGFNKD